MGKEHYRNAAHARKVENAFEMAMDCDALAFVVDAARQLERRDLRVLQTMRRTRAFLREMASERGINAPRAVLVLNKVDKVSRERRGDLMKIVEDVRADGGLDDFERVFPVSALTGNTRSKSSKPPSARTSSTIFIKSPRRSLDTLSTLFSTNTARGALMPRSLAISRKNARVRRIVCNTRRSLRSNCLAASTTNANASQSIAISNAFSTFLACAAFL